MYTCIKCKQTKVILELKYDTLCIICFNKKLEYNKNYYLKNRDKLISKNKEYGKTYYQLNKDKVLTKNRDYNHNNTHSINEQKKVYRQLDSYKQYQNNYSKNRKLNDIVYKLRKNTSKVIATYLKLNSGSKGQKSILKYLPYSFQELKDYLEKQFESWMTWNNYGKYDSKSWNDNDVSTWTWNVDHIIPQSDLPYISMEDENFKKCWSLENLRPYSAKQNTIDGSKRVRHEQ